MRLSKFASISLSILCFHYLYAQQTPFEKGNGNQSATYTEVIAFYSTLDASSDYIQLGKQYPTDCGEPIIPVILGNPNTYKSNPKVFINNGIHPGEPDGIDASMMLARDILKDPLLKALLDKLTIIIIPVYNIGGSLNGSCCTRANQQGPEIQGFRGNARLLDLNRDFIKQDSRNAQSFSAIFLEFLPEFFVDTHVSNGSDYQYTMTLLSCQKDKLDPEISKFMQQVLEPKLFAEMEAEGWPMIPYVNTKTAIPDSGIVAFLETPRFATGFTGLFQTIGFTTETHMLKPFEDRVWSTYTFLKELVLLAAEYGPTVQELREDAFQRIQLNKQYGINWKLDTTQFSMLNFNGYVSEILPSKVSGFPQLTYNRKKPFTKPIKFYNTYKPTLEKLPKTGYIIPYAWKEVVDRLQNQLQFRGKMTQLGKDTSILVEYYRIESTESTKVPYEGHFLHSNTQVKLEKSKVQFSKYDYVIPIEGNEVYAAWLLQVLSPHAVDSYFNWNFYDEIMQQKEYFSAYVFDETASKLLKEDSKLQIAFETAKKSDPSLAKNQSAQLMWIYKHSNYYEKSHLRHPVFSY